ncbi:J domain-containing protein [Undibacterium squillarum]|uniref:J domain-containing protein n=1 Tax=Undibacterium squillarum TaxID=1131567 RepID=UPI0035AE8E2A
MTMSSSTHLNISASKQENALSKEQKRFNTLIGKIEQYKQTLAALKTDITAFEIVFAHEYYPQVQAIDALKAQLIKQIDQAAGQTKLNKRLEKIIGRLIFDLGREMLDADSEPALKAIFLYWCDIDLDQEHAAEKARAEQGLRDDATNATDIADTGQRGQSHFAEGNAEESADDAATAAENARQEHARRRQAAKQARIAQQEKAVSLSIREVYRKLASMLHPDREQDEQKRSEKNTLMQEVNAAYEARDLLSLLEMQRRLEQIDPQHLASLSKEKLQHYLQVLAEQEKELRAEIQFETNTFRQRFGIGNHDKISVQVNQLKKEAKTLQKMVSALERDLLILQKTGDISVMLSAFGY